MSYISSLFNIKENPGKRLAWVDYAKGLATLLVVYRHLFIGIDRTDLLHPNPIFLQLNEVVYTFRMPMFFVLSGIFVYKGILKRSLREFIYNKLSYLFYPYILWATIHVTIQIVLKNYVNADRDWVDYLYIFIRPRAVDQFWFLYALFNCTMLFLFLSKSFKGNRWIILSVGVLLQFLFQFKLFKDIAVLNDVLHYFFYVALGNFFSKYLLDKDSSASFFSFKWTLILLPVFALCQWYWLSHEDSHSINVFIETFIATVGTSLALNLSFLIARTNRFHIFPFVGRYSLWVYLLHPMPGAAMRVLLLNYAGITNVPVLLSIQMVFATILPIIFYEVCEKMGLWFLFSWERPKQSSKGKIPEQKDLRNKA